jgi:hypothetical protein
MAELRAAAGVVQRDGVTDLKGRHPGGLTTLA